MALASIGGGQQIGDGNTSELLIGYMAAPQTATSTATLTVAQVTGGTLVGNPSTTAATYTMPTGTLLDAALGNIKVDSTFELTVINIGTSTGVITMAVGTGITAVGHLALPTAAAGSTAQFRFRKTAANTFTVYRIA